MLASRSRDNKEGKSATATAIATATATATAAATVTVTATAAKATATATTAKAERAVANVLPLIDTWAVFAPDHNTATPLGYRGFTPITMIAGTPARLPWWVPRVFGTRTWRSPTSQHLHGLRH